MIWTEMIWTWNNIKSASDHVDYIFSIFHSVFFLTPGVRFISISTHLIYDKSVMWPISYSDVVNERSQMILSNSNDLTQIDCSNFFRNFWFWVLDTKLSKPWKYFELSLQIRFLYQMLRWFLTFQSIKVLPHGIIQVVGRLYSVSYWKSVTYWWFELDG